jgi:phospholipase C
LREVKVPAQIQNIFVLMLENRSFDHMLGFSGIAGTDAETGKPTTLNGLTGTESNGYRGQTYTVAPNAVDPMPVDPGHEFLDVLEQLCGTNATYPSAGPYPPINNSGFVGDYAHSPSPDEGNAPGDYGQILACFAPADLPVIKALAKSFAVCDAWHASLPGPTLPNRLFALAASSAGLDHSPSTGELTTWETVDGLEFAKGTIFDALTRNNGWRIYSGGDFPLAAVLKGIEFGDALPFADFAADVAAEAYPWRFTWIEPDYGDFVQGTYKGGTSQHPLDGVAGGEGLIKAVYEAIRGSPHWENSLLIVTWDEHGGFYDHVAPPPATPPGDTAVGSKYNQYGFAFDRYGVRVPAVVVSPYIPANTIDHRPYDHSSIPKTIEGAFGLASLTNRDKAAQSVLSLLTLPQARTDTPTSLFMPSAPSAPSVTPAAHTAAPAPVPEGTVDSGSLPGFLQIAMRHDIALSPTSQKHAILARVQAIQTRAQAAQYIAEVGSKVRAARAPRS